MNVYMEIANKGLHALLQLFINPFYYIGIIFIILQYRRQISLERKLFHTKLHSLLGQTWKTLLWGWVGGLAASIVMAFVGATVQAEAIVFLWVISLLLLFIRVRFLCWAYAIGVIGILHSLWIMVPALSGYPSMSWFADPLLQLNMPSLLALIAILHIVEAILIRKRGAETGTPMFYESKRGKIVGGYQLQGFWPVVLFLVVPMQGGGSLLPWTPLMGGDLWSGGWAIIGFPMMLGFADITLSRLPQEKARISSNLLLLYAAVVLLLALLAYLGPIATIIASMGCIALHESLRLYSRWDESNRQPYFVHDHRGLKILGIIPGSPAAELGIVPGEMIHKVNGQPIGSRQELHQAIMLNSAFCKLEILNLAGENKFLKRAMFSGEHHQLGIILAPDQDALYYAEEKQLHFLGYLRSRLSGVNRKQPRKPVSVEEQL
ncbi:PDZ domain-containing protein [Paenibacillus agricola]|uniref:PDZ domain-containing protein n=1 Tax=Paenibacillus agricola TaxID=2716264 RepID=A0ABX0JG87_9BACL|nr:PDZ domain-containing protein [Paenibacillus agricola]NHN33912.1 PDZ domain-containing protein [Paenibacillus agricola]